MNYVPIAECVKSIKKWNPRNSSEDIPFQYIDLSSVDRDSKLISQTSETFPAEAPSRARQLVATNDVLVATVRPNLNGVAVVPEEFDGATASTGFCVLRPKDKKLDHRYLFHWVKTPQFIQEMVKCSTGANYPAVSDKTVKSSKLPLPVLAEQKRIAAILDKADAIRRKRQETIALADTFLRSVFLKMFGDPATNPMGWNEVCFSEVLAGKMSNGLSPSSSGSYPGVVYTLSSITGGIFNDKAKKEALFDKEASKYYAQQYSFMICRGNGNKKLVGRGKFPTGDYKTTMVPDTIITAPINTDTIVPEFLEILWANQYVRRQLEKASRTTSGIYKINQKILNQTMILVPPVGIQQAFQEIASKVQSYLAKISSIYEETLFSSLQQRAFRGDL